MDGARLVDRLAEILGAQVIETHISWVLLTPSLAYKLKKPVHLPFVDYSTPQRRLHFCEEEVRLNQPLAAGLYLGVSRITGTVEQPGIDGEGPAIEHAVRMRRFGAGALFSEQLQAGTLADAAVDRLAAHLARFHTDAAALAPPLAPGAVARRLLAAAEGAHPVLGTANAELLRRWITHECGRLEPLWAQRAGQGRIRECHGDLHLANIVSLDGDVAAFDCIEFDAALRCIDVLEDAAFPLMDFIARGRADLGWRFMNAWLEQTGDYAGLPALRLYLVGRALVRACVEHLREPGGRTATAYARTARDAMAPPTAQLTITHGLPGSGKSFASQRLAQQGAIRIRSDVERKRLFGLGALERSRERGVDLYTPKATQATYRHLLRLARGLLQAGFPVVLDAAYLRHSERDEARALAAQLSVPFTILACDAPYEVLRARILARHADRSEADVAVLDHLMGCIEPLTPAERGCTTG